MRPRRASLSLVGIALIAILPASARGDTTITDPDFAGPVGDTGGHVALRVNREHGKVVSVRFAASRVRLRCEDGSTERTDYNLRTADYLGHGIFDATFGREHSYYRIHGRVLNGGGARGFFATSSDAAGDPDVVQCSTDGGPQRWHAAHPRDHRAVPAAIGQRSQSNRRAQSQAYGGSVVSDDVNSVNVHVRSQGGGPIGGTYEASNVQFTCESEEGEVSKAFEIPPLALHFVSPRMFYADTFAVRKGVLAFAVSVRGRLNDDGQLLGPIYALHNPPDPARGPDSPPECRLGPGDLWKAELGSGR